MTQAADLCRGSLGHFPEYCELSEVHAGGFFLRKNPIRRMVLVYTFPENAFDAHLKRCHRRHRLPLHSAPVIPLPSVIV